MQALDLLGLPPVSANDSGTAPTHNSYEEAPPDGEFDRMMERAMSPDQNDPARLDKTSRKPKPSTSPAKIPAPKGQSNPAPAPASPTDSPGTTALVAKTKAVPASVAAPSKAAKEEKSPTDPATILPLVTDPLIEPPVILLPPLVLGNGAAGESVTEKPANTANGTVTALSGALSHLVGPAGDKISTSGLLSGKSGPNQPETASPKVSPPSQTLADANPATITVPATATDPKVDTAKLEELAPTVSKLNNLHLAAAKVAEMANNDGTRVAFSDLPMKKSENSNKVAGLDAQILPVGMKGEARETVLPPHAAVMPAIASEKLGSDLNLPISPATPTNQDTAETSGVIALPSLADARMRDVERTQDLVSLHALRMVDSKSDSLQVVIRPGAGTEMSLELRHRNGGVEAEAILQRGDYQLMNQHWPELQQKLEQRGIRLAPLGGDPNFSPANNGSFSQQQSTREEAAKKASAFAEFTVAMSRGGATARLAPATLGGWESWA